MKLLRTFLACGLLLLAASPTYAIHCFTCSDIDPFGCDSTPDSQTRCRFHIDFCETISAPFCTGLSGDAAATTVLADWQVASIEISRPGQVTTVVTSPSAVAQAKTTSLALQK